MTRTPLHFVVLMLLIPLTVYVWIQILKPSVPVLTVSFIDVGQGDAILIETPNGNDILIDGGPDRSILRQLPKEMGILDRTIDLVIATHPDKDHIAGLASVLDRYQVQAYMDSGVQHDSPYVDALGDAVASEFGIETYLARRSARIHVGGGAYMDVLYPDRDITHLESNTGSIVARLVYGNVSFMLTGDAPDTVEEYVVALDGEALKSTVLKAGHHGSKTSTSDLWLTAVQPEIAIVSAGKDNSYGHPSPEVIERLKKFDVDILSTIQEGTITLVSDGVGVWRE